VHRPARFQPFLWDGSPISPVPGTSYRATFIASLPPSSFGLRRTSRDRSLNAVGDSCTPGPSPYVDAHARSTGCEPAKFSSHALYRCRSTACRPRCALARPSRASNENHRTDRDVGFRLRRASGATGLAESGFTPPIWVYFEHPIANPVSTANLGNNIPPRFPASPAANPEYRYRSSAVSSQNEASLTRSPFRPCLASKQC
jgi:hypothetical protein